MPHGGSYRGIDDYLEDRRKDLIEFSQTMNRAEAKKRASGPQGVLPHKPRPSRPDTRPGDAGVKINAKNVQVTRTGLDRRKRTLDQRSTRGYGGRKRG